MTEDEALALAEERVAEFERLWTDQANETRAAVQPWKDEVRRLRALLAVNDSDVARMEEALKLHYGENVMAASRYCQAFYDWRDALAAKLADPDVTDYDRQVYAPVVEALNTLTLSILKSNYLARRIYGGEAHRTEKCPVHKGRWSGCFAPDSVHGACPCATSGDTCGWLPA